MEGISGDCLKLSVCMCWKHRRMVRLHQLITRQDLEYYYFGEEFKSSSKNPVINLRWLPICDNVENLINMCLQNTLENFL